MLKLLRDTKGAVTVFVTLLLIPAMLVSGTAVDLVRLHTAKSIIQDANQLALNSVLTQYNALLYDLYGIMGVAEDDPIFGALIDEYISVTIFGEEGKDRTLGTLQVFYSANLSMEEPFSPDDKHLRNEDVLRRQIEEYMKFRGPVVLVMEFIEALTDNKLKEDAEIIKDKMEIDSAIADLYDKSKELYEAIAAADKSDQVNGGMAGGTVGTVSSGLKLIKGQFADLKSCYDAWKRADTAIRDAARAREAALAALAKAKTDEEKAAAEDALAAAEDAMENAIKEKANQEVRYGGIRGNIRAYTIGGKTNLNWSGGRWTGSGNTQGLNKTIENAIQYAENWKPKFDVVVTLSKEIDAMNGDLSRKIDQLEGKLNAGGCGAEVKRIFTTLYGDPPKTILERYRDILKWDAQPMAEAYKAGGYSYIDDVMKPLLESVRYRNGNDESAPGLSREELANVPVDSRFSLESAASGTGNPVAYYAGFTDDSVTYKMPPGFKKFAAHSDRHKALFDELTAMINQPDADPVKLYEGQKAAAGKNSEEKQRNMIGDLLELVNSAYGGLSNSPLGASYLIGDDTPGDAKLNILEIGPMFTEALTSPMLGVIQDPMSEVAKMGDYMLLLAYSASVFSNYATARPDSAGKTREDLPEIAFPTSITGVPMSPEVNYFFQSEWEYLYNGSENAGKNLSAVTRLMFLLRFVCNYILVFSVPEITSIVSGIQAAFSWAPPLGIILGEQARAAFVAAESLIDVAALRAGHKIPLLKNISGGEWVCSPGGLADALDSLIARESVDGSRFENAKGLTYSQYMLFFFITKAAVYEGSDGSAANELAKRTGNLIEWNVINYLNGVCSDEKKMAGALGAPGRFRLKDMKTDFSITTTVDMRMLFLSMLFARNFADSRGIGIAPTMPVTVTDYRGY